MEKSLEKSLYHSFLRIAICVFGFALVFDSGLLFSDTAKLSNLTQMHLASVVGVTVAVAPTEVNQLTARITELESELDAKERLIAVNVRESNGNSGIDKSTFILSVILFILLVLIVLNYALDYVRGRKSKIIYEESTSSMA